MFKALATHSLQHLIKQNSWASAALQPFSGKSVQINIPPLVTHLLILEDGNLAIAGETNIPDATVTLSFSLLLRLIAKDEAAKLQIRVTGDTHLASELSKILSHIHWDITDDLSKIIGDVPAHKISQLGQNTLHTAKETGINLVEMLSEYWQEEQALIAKKYPVEKFNQEVDVLRADVERLEKRLSKLTQSLSPINHP